jgi:hypothetical protein
VRSEKKGFKLEIDRNAKPIRTAEWYEEGGLARLKVIKFEGRVGKWLCNALSKPNYIIVNLDEMGSFIWKRCDGKTTVGEILDELKESMGERFEKEGMEPRSFYFMRMLRNRGFLAWREEESP